MNSIQERILGLISSIEDGTTDWNVIIADVLRADLKFFEYEKPTLDRQVYTMLNQLLDIINLKSEEKYWAIPYEFADLLSLAIGYMAVYGDPAYFTSERVKFNSKVKGEEAIVKRYENRWQKLGVRTIHQLYALLALHKIEGYFNDKESKEENP